MCSLAELSESLTGVGYNWSGCSEEALANALKGGLKNESFLHLIKWITDEMRVLGSIEEKLSGDYSDLSAIQLELSGFLKELQCPIASFVSGPVSTRFHSEQSLVLLLNYLLSELMAMKMVYKLMPKSDAMVIEISESEAAAALKQIMIDLNLGKPPSNVTSTQVFNEIVKRLNMLLPQAGSQRISAPLFTPTKPLTEQQWQQVEQFQRELDSEYDMRRQMLATRLDVTVQSFQWSDKSRPKQDKIVGRYADSRKRLDAMLSGGESTSVAALLAARDDLTIIEKTSNASIRTQSDIQKHVMGAVPDRGGRASEHAPPMPEMPSWSKRVASGGGGRGGGHRGGGNQRGGYQPQRQQPPHQNAGYPAQSSGYQQSVGYGAGGGGGGHHHHHQNNRGGGGRVQGGWSQAGNNSQPQGGGYGGDSQSSNNNNRGGGGRGRSNYRRGKPFV